MLIRMSQSSLGHHDLSVRVIILLHRWRPNLMIFPEQLELPPEAASVLTPTLEPFSRFDHGSTILSTKAL